MKLSKEDFSEVGALVNKNGVEGWTDAELTKILAVYDCLLAFFDRQPERSMTHHLNQSRNMFEGFVAARKWR